MANSRDAGRKSLKTVMPERVQAIQPGINNLDGIYEGTVIENKDVTYMGRIMVHIPMLASPTNIPVDPTNPKDDGLRPLLLLTPFGGSSSAIEACDDPTTYGTSGTSKNGTPKSYGMWPQPPVPGTKVVCAYSSSSEQAFYLGSLVDYDRNHMMGGRASGAAYMNGNVTLAPTGEKNPKDKGDKDARPLDPESFVYLKEQGLLGDLVRGHSNSSARRESPSKVFGITTNEGHVLTMDDGDSEGQSKNIRIRTKHGAQVLMDDTNKLIFINNHDGTSWIEMDSEGNIDIYAKGKISMHTEDDFNIHSKGDINMHADKDINMLSRGNDGIRMSTDVGNIEVSSGKHLNMYASLTSNILSSHHVETANRIDMNGPVAKKAAEPVVYNRPENRNVTVSVATRVPEHHPWEGVNAKQTIWRDSKGKNAQ